MGQQVVFVHADSSATKTVPPCVTMVSTNAFRQFSLGRAFSIMRAYDTAED